MWKIVNINSEKSTVKSHVTLHSTWNAHICTLFSHSKNNMWRHVENIKHKLQKIHSLIPCDTIFHMKYTYLHINSTQQELHLDVCEKIWTYTAENPQLNPMWHYIPHEMHILAHYFHTARITCGCMWKSLNMTAKNLQSNPVWPYIPHKMHMLAHYFHTTKSTCGCMWKSVNINSKKSTVKSRVALHSTWNAHTCTLFSHNKNYVWMHVEK